MTPAIVTLDNHIPGDTWPGIPAIGPILVSVDGGDPVPMSAPIASARMHWVQGENYKPAAKQATTPATGESPITLVDAATWELSVPPVAAALFPLARGSWYAHLEITDTDGTVWTTHEFRQSVGPDYTR